MTLYSKLQRSFEWDRPWRVGLIILTCNAGFLWSKVLEAINQQTFPLHRRLVIDSESYDTTVVLAKRAGFDVLPVAKKDFRHGATRQLGVEYCHDCDILIFMTQDALLHQSDALSTLCEVFKDSKIATAYGRQIPHDDADFYAKTLRQFNYGPSSYQYGYSDRKIHGIKTVFNSNSFAAYRRDMLIEIGGFNREALVSEDVLATAALLQAGYQVAYVSDALVKHSHNYSWGDELMRYFDIGVTHRSFSDIFKEFNRIQEVGYRLLGYQIKNLLWSRIYLLPDWLIRVGSKFIGYQLGLKYQYLPRSWSQRLSQVKSYW